MRKLSVVHVEGNRALYGLALSDKVKAWTFIDELSDQPGGSQTVDMQVTSSHPAATLVPGQIESSRFDGRTSVFCDRTGRRTNCFLAALISCECWSAPIGV